MKLIQLLIGLGPPKLPSPGSFDVINGVHDGACIFHIGHLLSHQTQAVS
jgi:hypothetical protein